MVNIISEYRSLSFSCGTYILLEHINISFVSFTPFSVKHTIEIGIYSFSQTIFVHLLPPAPSSSFENLVRQKK